MTLGSHQTSIGKTQVHITPRWILEVLGPFDLDPAAADPRPWDWAAVNYTERDDGLRFGRPFLNPPFVPLWIRKLARHGCGTALLHARTETDWFEPIWESATVILFMADRLSFYRPDGTRQVRPQDLRHRYRRSRLSTLRPTLNFLLCERALGPRDRADPFPPHHEGAHRGEARPE
jgi:hypothetical protein